MRLLAFLGACAVALAEATGAQAQSFPSKPVTILVPVPAGGITDTIARIIGERMKTSLGQPVIVENVPGGGGTIAATRLLRSAPDGTTIGIGQWTTHVGAGAMYPVTFDYLKDFEPIAMLSTGPVWIIGRKDFPAKDIKELIAWLKANPGKATGGTVGVGSVVHMCQIYVANAIGTTMQYVPYRGAAPLMTDLLAGQIDLSCPEAGQTLSQYRAGTIKAYAVLTPKRWFAAPDVPTLDEVGVPNVHFPFWHALWAPKGTPKDAIAKLNAAVVEALADPAIRQKFTDFGHEVALREQQTPEGLAAVQKADIEKWWPIIKAANIPLQQ
jgi:tripartite-type tricarboxylate transporter receptor subunit TctC